MATENNQGLVGGPLAYTPGGFVFNNVTLPMLNGLRSLPAKMENRLNTEALNASKLAEWKGQSPQQLAAIGVDPQLSGEWNTINPANIAALNQYKEGKSLGAIQNNALSTLDAAVNPNLRPDVQIPMQATQNPNGNGAAGILNSGGVDNGQTQNVANNTLPEEWNSFFSDYKNKMGGDTESLADFNSRLKNEEFQSDFLRNERLKTGAAFLGAISGGVQAYTGLQQLDLAKESFRFNRNLARVNLANQTKLANLEIGERNLARSGKGQSSLSNAEAVDRVGLVGKV